MKNKAARLMLDRIYQPNWIKVTHEEFHKNFDARRAELFSSFTDCSRGYALSVFSMDGVQDTHKTEHNYGLRSFPDFYVNASAIRSDGVVSIIGKV